jgi:hypothetical protein
LTALHENSLSADATSGQLSVLPLYRRNREYFFKPLLHRVGSSWCIRCSKRVTSKKIHYRVPGKSQGNARSTVQLNSFKGFTFVGLGSFAFHATMLYQAQLADELPMIFVASYANYLLFNTQPGNNSLSRRALYLIAALLSFNILFIWS